MQKERQGRECSCVPLQLYTSKEAPGSSHGSRHHAQAGSTKKTPQREACDGREWKMQPSEYIWLHKRKVREMHQISLR